MNTPTRQGTAKIYRFPSRVRLAGAATPHPERSHPARLYSMCDYGSAWYHEAAVQDDHRDRKS